ncbi:MAG: hypothetical protein C5S49_04295 [Candidatus Methanogaster sp.]|nr:MAG: hypothetical protein C5S49_04295 [ANME-2 cluster archaeon]
MRVCAHNQPPWCCKPFFDHDLVADAAPADIEMVLDPVSSGKIAHRLCLLCRCHILIRHVMILDQHSLPKDRRSIELFEDLERRKPGHVVYHDIIDLCVHDLLWRYLPSVGVCCKYLFSDGHSHDSGVGDDWIKRCVQVALGVLWVNGVRLVWFCHNAIIDASRLFDVGIQNCKRYVEPYQFPKKRMGIGKQLRK